MNKRCYRHIVNRTRGELQVVSELARGCGTPPAQGRNGGRRRWVALRPLALLVGLAVSATPVLAAGIVADGRAPASQQPQVIDTQNGLPQVNISAPNQAGLSHNQYQQFDVDKRGAILNNSATMTQTQLAGMVQGNPNLNGRAPARVILNEVNSSNPSQLRGYLEVAGGKAQVIVANPAGLLCDGCGTINAGRMTLSTGRPQWNQDGSLAGWQVERGRIEVAGGGLNDNARNDTAYVELLARTVKINGSIRATREATVVAGRNRISADGSVIQPLAGESGPAELAIDMGQMGGMYSGAIRMIATEAGVGVRNRGGQLQADKTLTVSSNGRLVWQDNAHTQAGGDIRLQARDDIEQHGTLYTGGKLQVSSTSGHLRQSGTLAAAGDVSLQAAQGIDSRGNLLAGSDINSSLVHKADLILKSKGTVRAGGRLLSRGDVTVSGSRVDLSGSRLAAGRAILQSSDTDRRTERAKRRGSATLTEKPQQTPAARLANNPPQTGNHQQADRQQSPADAAPAAVSLAGATLDVGQLWLTTSGDIAAQNASVSAGSWQITGNDLWAEGGVWTQTGDALSRFQLTGALDNRSGSIEAQDLSLQAASLNNTNGRLVALGEQAQRWQTDGPIGNDGGLLGSNGALALDAGSISNVNGTLTSQGSLTMNARDGINNQQGKIISGGTLGLSTAGVWDNRDAQVMAENLQLTAQGLNNAGGKLLAVEHLRLDIDGDTDNQGGTLQAGELTLNGGGTLDNRNGRLFGQQAVRLHTGNVNNNDGWIGGQQIVTLEAGRLENRNGSVLSSGDATLKLSELDNRSGQLKANGVISVNAGNIDNRHGEVYGGSELKLLAARTLDNRNGQLTADGSLQLQAQDLDNRQGHLTSRLAAVIAATGLANREGQIYSSSSLNIASDRLDNREGRLLAEGDVTLQGLAKADEARAADHSAAALSAADRALSTADAAPGVAELLNQRGTIESGGTLNATLRALNNTGGSLTGGRALTLALGGDYTHRTGDTLTSNGRVTLSVAGILTNLAQWLLPGDLQLTSNGLNNSGSLVGKTLQLTTGLLQNDGRIEADNLQIASDRLDNRATLTGDRIAVTTGTLDNHGSQALIAATERTDLTARQRLTNRDDALIYSAGDLQLRSGDLIENLAATIEADGNVAFNAARLENRRIGLEIEREAEEEDYRWHRYNYYWRSYKSGVNRDKNTMAPVTQHIPYRDDSAVNSSRYGTILDIDADNKRAKVRVKNNHGREIELWVNYLALKPGAEGGFDMTFYATRGSHQDDVPTPYHNTFWREFNQGKIEQWDPQRHLDIFNAPQVTDYNNLRERSASGKVLRDRLVSEGSAARILAGGSMSLTIRNELLNDASTIGANGDLAVSGGGEVKNIGYSVNERRQEHIVDHYDKDTVHWHPEFDRDETTALSTIDGIISGNRNTTITAVSISNTTVGQAQTSLTEAAQQAAQAAREERERNPLATQVQAGEQRPGETDPSLTAQQQAEKVASHIPDNGLFHQRPGPESPYLVVTDPRFADRGKFISSDYLLQRVGYDPAAVHKRLGDGFYEQRVVREQLLNLTGRPSLHGEDAMAQYQALMNSGAQAASDLQLTTGVALTPAQIAALQQDIVWLVSETVQTAAGPQTVLVPKVYLAPGTLRLTGDGALIGGGELKLSAESINNAGNLFADGALEVTAGQFHHQGGDIRADAVQVRANLIDISTDLQNALRQAAVSARKIDLNGGDITMKGAKLAAREDLAINATHNITIGSARSSHAGSYEVISGSLGGRAAGDREEAGSRLATVSGEWQQALGSSITSDGRLSINAGNDLTVKGSQLAAGGQLKASAGGNMNLLAEEVSSSSLLNAASGNTRVSNQYDETRQQLSSISGAGGVDLQAGNTFRAEGAQVDSTSGSVSVTANQVSIGEVHITSSIADAESTRQGKTKASRTLEAHRDGVTGSTFSGQEGVLLNATSGDVTLTASTLHSESGEVAVSAKRDVILNTATEREEQSSDVRSTKKGFLNKKTTHIAQEDRVTREQGSTLSGNRVTVTAGHDVKVSGSAVVGDDDVNIRAGNRVDISAATETDAHYLLEEKKKSGLSGTGGIGFSIGKQSSRHEIDEKGTTQSQSVSTIGSRDGSLNITANDAVHVAGADLVAGKNMTLSGSSVTVDPGHDQRTRDERFEQKSSGLTLALSGAAGGAINTAVTAAQAARKESDSRLAGLQATKTGLAAVQAQQAMEMDSAKTGAADARNQAAGLKPGDEGFEKGATDTIGISASLGSQSSKSESHSDSSRAQGSTLSAGGNISITATGQGNAGASDNGNISINGSQVDAGGDVALNAKNDIYLTSAQNREQSEGTNSSRGGSLGVGVTAGSGGAGFNVSANVNAGKGSEHGNSVTHTETTVSAGNNLVIISGGDTTLKGAQASGKAIVADAGGNLTIASEQDSDRYDSRQQNASAGAGYTLGAGGASGNVSASRDKIHSNYDSVREQSGLFAGEGGFNVNVGKHTQLDGSVISSTATADKNSLTTGTLGWSDIHNRADVKSEHQGVGLSSGGSIGSQFGGNMENALLAGVNHKDSAEGATKAAVSAGSITIRDGDAQKQDVSQLSRDAEGANGSIGPIFNKEKEQKRLQQAQLIAEIGSQAADIVRTQGTINATREATEKLKNLSETEREKAEADWQKSNPGKTATAKDIGDQAYKTFFDRAMNASGMGTGGWAQRAVQAATAVVQGLAGGDIAKAIAGGSAPYIAEVIGHQSGLDAKGKLAAHAVVNAVLAAVQGNSVLAGAAGAVTGEAVGILAQEMYGKNPDELSESERQTVSALATVAAGLAGGLAGNGTADAVAGAQAGKTTVENNFLGATSSDKLDKAVEKIKQGDKSLAAANELIKLENADKRSDALVSKFTKDPSQMNSAERAELAGYLRVYAAEMEKEYGSAVSQELVKGLLSGQDYIKRSPDSEAMAKAQTIMNTWGYHKSNASIGDAPLLFGGSVLGNTIREGMAVNAAIGAGVNTVSQLSGNDPFSYVDVIMAGITSAATTGKGIGASAGINMGGAAIGSGIKGEDPTNSVIGAGVGTIAGSGAGKLIKNSASKVIQDKASDITGAIGGSYVNEKTSGVVKETLDVKDKKNDR
ncbi:filamentous hemagglutinin N-terminal domain-containing protein [Erwinia sp. E602]|uniref:hemagglutinin repeat-containing protein n=1 Tax=Erwinia sp. E602 TaxID=2675378 RepID=UPI001BA9903E|nr:hemagglutinin repeat-containing protein [Erwinia sp. E602]QUG76200.1 filamentous hemagglutinin N-terminal domain-containing protein [Erwinia sp. E602]